MGGPFRHRFVAKATGVAICLTMLATGCGTAATNQTTGAAAGRAVRGAAGGAGTSGAAGAVGFATGTATVAQVTNTQYDPARHVVTLYVRQNKAAAGSPVQTNTTGNFNPAATANNTNVGATGGSEDVVNLDNHDGIINYATAKYSTKIVRSIRVVDVSRNAESNISQVVTVPSDLQHPGPPTAAANIPTTVTSTAAVTAAAPVVVAGSTNTKTSMVGDVEAVPTVTSTSSVPIPPPGVTIDRKITPLASVYASSAQKWNAISQVATSKLNTPYIWGHNEDRGQYGFDCSNFTEYVYHHALGYLFTTASRGQNLYVGVTVPISTMRQGDLLIFNQGSHVGIYAGNGQAIQCGGGLAKVGYLNVSSTSYWGQHITAVKRMY